MAAVVAVVLTVHAVGTVLTGGAVLTLLAVLMVSTAFGAAKRPAPDTQPNAPSNAAAPAPRAADEAMKVMSSIAITR
ncbi:hypothetical protein [Burkholderia sp. MBR-1]|uniref:hypothetical protein n=1 Tax=Burkholderia sp. MBR-1 TaxID=2732364 RepID=UPI0015EF1EE9|nr:hypothetical protein [Burkholderia sp. MBR-1]QMI46997.1 hypothetical protein MBR110_15975 [Burkholderia sp. MBR-1]